MKNVKLGDIVTYIRGITFKPENKVEIGVPNSVVCMRTKNIQQQLDESDLIAVPKDFVKREEQYLRQRDLLISSANSWDLVGKCIIMPNLNYSATAGGFISIIRPNEFKVNSKYLYFWLSSSKIQERVRYCARQTTNIANLDSKQFLDLTIPLPTLEEQDRIVAILDKAEDVKKKRQETIRLTDEFLRSVFLEMFGDPVRNEKGWEKVQIEKVCKFENGDRSSNYPNKNDLRSHGVLFLSSSDIVDFRFVFKNSSFISESKYNSLRQGKCVVGDVLVTLRGNGLGKCCVFESNYEKAFINAQMVILHPNDRIANHFLVQQIKCDSLFRKLLKVGSGSAQPQLTAEQLKRFNIILPPVRLQSQFVQMVKKVENQKKQLERSLNKLEVGFSGMMDKAFRGEL